MLTSFSFLNLFLSRLSICLLHILLPRAQAGLSHFCKAVVSKCAPGPLGFTLSYSQKQGALNNSQYSFIFCVRIYLCLPMDGPNALRFQSETLIAGLPVLPPAKLLPVSPILTLPYLSGVWQIEDLRTKLALGPGTFLEQWRVARCLQDAYRMQGTVLGMAEKGTELVGCLRFSSFGDMAGPE